MGDVFDIWGCIWGRRALPKGGLGAMHFFPECVREGKLDLRLAWLCWMVKDSPRTLRFSPDRIIYTYTTKHVSWKMSDRIIYAR